MSDKDNFMFGHDPLDDMPEEYNEQSEFESAIDESLGIPLNPLTVTFMREVASKIGLNHLAHVDELAAAFMARHRIDPDEAEVATTMKVGEDGPIWTTRIVRRTHGCET
jgi:hypothetical protein